MKAVSTYGSKVRDPDDSEAGGVVMKSPVLGFPDSLLTLQGPRIRGDILWECGLQVQDVANVTCWEEEGLEVHIKKCPIRGDGIWRHWLWLP